jgi:alkylation response protein AidB-like acyl-CoA dehydrogenase
MTSASSSTLSTNAELGSLLEHLKATAAERDRLGGHAAAEKQLIKAAGLLTLSIPEAYGGKSEPWSVIYDLVRRIAAADSALAHVFSFHHLQIATVILYGSPAQQRQWLGATAQEGLWWGNAMNPLDQRLVAQEFADGFVVNGVKGFCSGALGSDWMTLSAIHRESKRSLYAVIPTNQSGVRILDDWDPVGQRQTDSHSVVFDSVFIPADSILKAFDAAPTDFQSLRTCFAQLVLVNLYLGIAIGACQEAREYVHTQARPWITSGVSDAVNDSHTIRRFAEMHLQVVAATALADQAAAALEQAFEKGPRISPEERGHVAVKVAEAKVLAHRASLAVSSDLFEVVGARGAKRAFGFDRFWRNARTHTLHDPLDYKLDVLGRWALQGRIPTPDLYN